MRIGDFHDLYSSLSTVRVMREFRCRAFGTCGGEDNSILSLGGEKKLERKQPLRRPQNRWADDIKIDPKENGW